MKILRGLAEAGACRGGFVSIGNFDGVHRGHRSMLAALTRHARRAKAPSLAFTFDPPPIALLRPQQIPPPLTTIERKLELLDSCGVDATLVYCTDSALLNLSPREFFDRIVVEQLNARGLVEGLNFCFGRDRAGTISTLQEFSSAAGIELDIVPSVLVDGLLVSSTEIRRLVGSGDVRLARDLLGLPYRVRGTVAVGAKRGRTIGFPTANLIDVRTMLPFDGVYAGRALVGDAWHAAAVNVGPNPTFAERQRKVEAHLLGYEGDLYGATLDIEFLDRLRETRTFAGPEELKAQVARDVARASAIAESNGAD